MKKTFFTLLIMFLMQTCCFADNSIRFVQVTDSHFESGHQGSIQMLTDTVKDINKLKDISFVVFTGDNIDHPREQNLVDFLDIVNKLNVPYYLVMGNHDPFKSQGLSKERYTQVVREHNWKWLYRGWNYTFKKNGYVFIVLDGAKEVIPGTGGYYRDDTLAWFDKQLTKYENKPVIVFQHFPVLESKDFSESRYKTHKVYQPEKYFNVLNKHHNVLAIVSGHLHINSEVMQDGVYHINTPALMSDPHRYKIIDIVSKNGLSPIVYTQLKEVEAQ